MEADMDREKDKIEWQDWYSHNRRKYFEMFLWSLTKSKFKYKKM